MNLTEFPNRVWFETGNGWASREADKEDRDRRTMLIREAAFRKFDRDLKAASEVPDTKLRRRT